MRGQFGEERKPMLAGLRTGSRENTARAGELPTEGGLEIVGRREKLPGKAQEAAGELEGRASGISKESGTAPARAGAKDQNRGE